MKTLPILTCASLLTLLSGCELSEHHEPEALIELEVSQPLRQDTELVKEYVSQIRAWRHIEMRALEKGYLQDTFVDEGQVVEAGQPMFKIMPNVYEAEYERARAEANVAQIEYQNTKSLSDKSIVSENELMVAEARLAKARAEARLAKAHLDFTDVNAPFTGMMDHLEARTGSLLDEGELLTTLSDLSTMWVYFNIPESEYLNYTLGGQSLQGTEVRLKLANGMIFEHPGRIETIEADFDNTTGNIEVRAAFPNPDLVLRHGQTGNIMIAEPYENALLIPQKATFDILDKRYVYIVNEENRLEQRQIEVAAELPHLFIVSDGLEANEQILLEGLRRVRNEQEIIPRHAAPERVVAHLDLYAE